MTETVDKDWRLIHLCHDCAQESGVEPQKTCNKCGKVRATFRLTNVQPDGIRSLRVCELCAKKSGWCRIGALSSTSPHWQDYYSEILTTARLMDRGMFRPAW